MIEKGLKMICGHFMRKFKNGNLVVMVDVPCNGDYDGEYSLIEVKENSIIIDKGEYPIQRDKNNKEFIVVEHTGVYERLISGKPSKIKCCPFLDQREHRFKPEPEDKQTKQEAEKERQAYIKKMERASERLKDPSSWYTKCSECRHKAYFRQNKITGGGVYACDCGWTLEV